MEFRTIGALEVSVVGLGCNNFGSRIDEARTRDVIDAALDAGITLLDTADNYGATRSETYLGRALSGRRDRVILATKFGGWNDADQRESGASPANVRASVEASLRRLATDRIDLFQLHSPDASTPIADTLGALGELVRAGKVREIGCSNFSAVQLHEANDASPPGDPRFKCVQNELSLMAPGDLDQGVAAAADLGIAYVPYFPLASGLLTGKVRRGAQAPEGSRIARWSQERREKVLTEATFDRLEELQRFAFDRGHTLLELAFAWLLGQSPVASVIAGATSASQVRQNAASVGWRLSASEISALAA